MKYIDEFRDGDDLTIGSASVSSTAFTATVAGLSSNGGDVNLATGTSLTRLLPGFEVSENPSWSPDGTKLVFDAPTAGSDGDLFVVRADGSDERRLTRAHSLGKPPRDPLHIAFSRRCASEMRP